MHLSGDKKNNTVFWALVILLVLAGLYLAIDHWQHIAPYSVFVFLLGCLAMHVFMRHDHGSHDGHEQ